jgi:hypothetical protein
MFVYIYSLYLTLGYGLSVRCSKILLTTGLKDFIGTLARRQSGVLEEQLTFLGSHK